MTGQNKNVKSRKIIKYAAFALAGLAALLVVGMALGRTANANSTPPEEKAFRVEISEVVPTGSGVFLEYTGLVQPAELTQVTFNSLGMIEKIYVEEGDEVKKDQLLAKLNAEDAERQQENMQELVSQTETAVINAQASRDQAQKDYEAACETADQDEMDDAKAKRDIAQKNYDSKKKELDQYNQQLNQDKANVQKAQNEYDVARAGITAAEKKATETAKEYENARLEKSNADEAYKQAQADTAAAQEKLELEPDNSELQVNLTNAQQAEQAALERKQTADADETKKKQTRDDAAAALVKENGKVDMNPFQQTLTDAQTKIAKTQANVTSTQTQVTAYETELATRKAAYEALKNMGPESAEAKARKQQLDAAENSLSVAKSAEITARNSYQNAQGDVVDCDLKAPSDGYVVKIVGNEGGMATPIAPALVLGSKRAMVQFGVSQNDIRKIEEGNSAQVTVGERTFEGTVSSIGTMPDPETRTYMVNVDILATTDEFYIGEMAQIKIEAGERRGAWMPLTCVLNDGEDYVYVVENGRAVRRVVTIVDVSDDKLLLEGLDTGSHVITEGMKTVRSGSAVITG